MRVLFALLALAVTVSAQGLTGPNFFITAGDGQNYTFSIDGAPVKDPALSLTVGTTYKFFLNTSMSTHPFGFSSNNDETVGVNNVPMEDFSGAGRGGVTTSGACTPGANPLSWYTTSGSETTNPCIVSITPPANITGLSIYYRCSIHPAMVGTLTAVAAGGSTTPPPSGTTTSPPTGTTTQTPTTPAPTGSSTGKNSAAVILPGAATLIIAAINVIFSA